MSTTHPLEDDLDDLRAQVRRSIDIREPDACWPWMGTIARTGYGRRGPFLAHRLAYELFVGPVPGGLQVGHTCHDHDETCPGGLSCPHRRCVNWVRHLVPMTQAENKAAGRGGQHMRGRRFPRCRQGHLFTEVNTITRPDGRRLCRICKNDRQRRWRAHA